MSIVAEHALSVEQLGDPPQLDAWRPEAPLSLTVLGYFSVDERTAQIDLPSPGGRSLAIPVPAKFAASCLAVGIGSEGAEVVAMLATAPWFAHLGHTATGPSHGSGTDVASVLDDMLGRGRTAHIVSVALSTRPGQAEVDSACAVGRAVRLRRAFAVVTVSQPSHAAVIGLGAVFDCLIDGDGGLHHHWYPHRTVTEPTGKRMICYDLHDVCSLWAGRVGRYGAMDWTADALHVEVSEDIDSLVEVERLVTATAAELEDPDRLRLFNVVAGARQGATAVSFSDNAAIRQERAAMRQDSMGDKR